MKLKEIIFDFLKENIGKKFNVRQVSDQTGISYPSTLKWVDILIAEEKILVDDYGNVKLVYIK